MIQILMVNITQRKTLYTPDCVTISIQTAPTEQERLIVIQNDALILEEAAKDVASLEMEDMCRQFRERNDLGTTVGI